MEETPEEPGFTSGGGSLGGAEGDPGPSAGLPVPLGHCGAVPEAPLAGMLAYDPQRDARPLSWPFLMAEEAARERRALPRGREEHPVFRTQASPEHLKTELRCHLETRQLC